MIGPYSILGLTWGKLDQLRTSLNRATLGLLSLEKPFAIPRWSTHRRVPSD